MADKVEVFTKFIDEQLGLKRDLFAGRTVMFNEQVMPAPVRLLSWKSQNPDVTFFGEDRMNRGGVNFHHNTYPRGDFPGLDMAYNVIRDDRPKTVEAAYYFVRGGQLHVRERGRGSNETYDGQTLPAALGTPERFTRVAVEEESGQREFLVGDDELGQLMSFTGTVLLTDGVTTNYYYLPNSTPTI